MFAESIDLDVDLPGRLVEGHEDTIPGRSGTEGELCGFDVMKAVYSDHRGWVDGVVPDEEFDARDIDVGPGTGLSSDE